MAMKSRMRAIAPVRTGGTNRRSVNQLSGGHFDARKDRHTCQLCHDSTHWPDQCLKFVALSYDERVKLTTFTSVA